MCEDPYENFMMHHLQYYGFFSGQEPSSQRKFSHNRIWETMCDSVLSDCADLETNSEDDNKQSRRRLCQVRVKTTQLFFHFNGSHFVPRLCQPRSLFPVSSGVGMHRRVYWPIDCEVIKDEIQHIEWDPPEPEPFYQPTGYERTPMPDKEGRGKVVYFINPATKSSCYTSSHVGGSRALTRSTASYTDVGDTSTLQFESRFQSGNLQKAVQVGVYDYELTLRTDLYTSKHTQWFYFRVRNMKAGVSYRFSIVNFMKSSSLYALGMKPLLYSVHSAQTQKVGWKRVGSDIKYYRNHCEHDGQTLYSLTWTFQFPHDGDTCYLAQSYPYTYSDLQRYLVMMTSHPAVNVFCKLRILCHTLAGNTVYVLTITSPSSSREEGRAKKAVVVTARVHPGETNSSWIMQGFLDFLLSDAPDAKLLRDTFVFKVVPMLNPDGVVVGNYRCSLAGCDLNRHYCTLLRDSFPCVWYTHSMVKRLMAEREVILYCDIHGHSRKNNVFMYGCDDRSSPALRLRSRVFPLMMSKNVPDKFSYKSCKFKVHKSKEGTGRVAMWKLGIANSYTMESTFGGSTLGKRKGTHLSTQDLKSLGYCFCDTLLDYCDPDPAKTNQCLAELRAMLQQEIRQKLGIDVDSDGLSTISVSDIESSTSGSNSSESDGLPVHLLYATNKELTHKKKHLKTRKERNRLRQKRSQMKNASVLKTESKIKVPIQEPITVENTNSEKTDKALFITKEFSQKRQTRAPHSSSSVSVLGQNSCLEPVSTANLKCVRELGGTKEPVKGRFPAFHSSVFRRSSAGSSVLQSRVVPEITPSTGLFPSTVCCPSPAARQTVKLPTRIQPKQVTLTYVMPEVTTSESTETSKKQETEYAENSKKQDLLTDLERK